MKHKKVIQEFISNMEKMPCISNCAELQVQLLSFSKVTFTETEAEFFMEAILKYIDIIINITANRGHRKQIKICRKWFDVLPDVITGDVAKVFLKKVTPKIFDIVIEESGNSWCVKKELLKTFLACVQDLPNDLRSKTVQELPDIYLYKIFDSISTYGDYDFQVTLIETIFQMYGKNAVASKITDLIPESQELSESFSNIKGSTFDEDVRRFLNSLNKNSKKIFSIVCKDIFLGDIKCGQPMEDISGFWVDFNQSENAVSWFCAIDPLGGENVGPNPPWNVMLFFVSDVKTVQAHRSPTSQEVNVCFKLKEPCISYEEHRWAAQLVDVKFIVSSDSDQARTLIWQVLPVMFRDRFHSIPKISLGTKAVYKPLRRSIYRRSRSTSSKVKSDVSSFTVGIDPVSGKSDVSSTRTDTKKLNSTSSASTVHEVISISDSSMQLIEPCKRMTQNIQESQYDTAEMCPLEPSSKICSNQPEIKISSTCRHDGKVFAERSFSEDMKEVQQHIEMLSGGCSGSKVKYSQNSAVASMPKKKLSSELPESNHLENFVGDDFFERSSCFETAVETLPNFPNRNEKKISRSIKHQGIDKKKCSTSKPPNKSQKETKSNQKEKTNVELEHEPSTSEKGESPKSLPLMDVLGHARYSFRSTDYNVALKLQQRHEKCSTGYTKKSQERAASNSKGEPTTVSPENMAERVTLSQSDDRVQVVEPCLDVLSDTERMTQNIQESQYDTAEMCPLEPSSKICSNPPEIKISSTCRNDGKVFSERSFIEDMKEVQQHIQMLSGSCSGSNVRYSQNSAVVSTPKKKMASEHQERNRLENFECSSCFETAVVAVLNSPDKNEGKISRNVKLPTMNNKKRSTSKSLSKSQKKTNSRQREKTNIKVEPSTSEKGESPKLLPHIDVLEHARYSFHNRDYNVALKLQQRRRKCSTKYTKKSQKRTASNLERVTFSQNNENGVTSKEIDNNCSASEHERRLKPVDLDQQNEPVKSKGNGSKMFDELLLEDVLEHVKNFSQNEEEKEDGLKLKQMNRKCSASKVKNPLKVASNSRYESVMYGNDEMKVLEKIPLGDIGNYTRQSSQNSEVKNLISQEKEIIEKNCVGSLIELEENKENCEGYEFNKKSDEVIILYDTEELPSNLSPLIKNNIPTAENVKGPEENQLTVSATTEKEEANMVQIPKQIQLELDRNSSGISEASVVGLEKKTYARKLSSTTNEDEVEELGKNDLLDELISTQRILVRDNAVKKNRLVSRKVIKKRKFRKFARAHKNNVRNKQKLENNKYPNRKILPIMDAEKLKLDKLPSNTPDSVTNTSEKDNKQRTAFEEKKASDDNYDSVIRKKEYTRQLSGSIVEDDIQEIVAFNYRYVELISECEKQFDELKKQDDEEKSIKKLACDEGLTYPNLIENKCQLFQQIEVQENNDVDYLILDGDKHANESSQINRANDNGIEKCKKQREDERKILEVEKNLETTDNNENKSIFGQTLSISLGGQKKRKLFDPDDLSYLENITLMEETGPQLKESESKPKNKDIVKNVTASHVGDRETSAAPIWTKTYRKKPVVDIKGKKRIKKISRLKVHNPVMLIKMQNITNLQSSFHKMLSAFKEEANSSFSGPLRSNLIRDTKSKKNKLEKTSRGVKKKNITKGIKIRNSTTKHLIVMNQCVRTQINLDQLETSLNLVQKQNANDETIYNLSDDASSPPVGLSKKINIISDIPIRPPYTMVEDDSRMPKKKMKVVENSTCGPEGVVPERITDNEICNWITTGSPNYTQVISERRNALKSCYLLLKDFLDRPDETEEYKEIVIICDRLKKFI